MSDDLNQAISDSWKSAGLDATSDSTDAPADVDDGQPTETADDDLVDVLEDDSPVVEDPLAADTTETPETTTADTTTEESPAVEVVEKATQQEAENDLAEALGLGKPPDDPKKRAQWWKTRLPFSQVHKAYGDLKKKLSETHDGVVRGHTEKISTYETRFADVEKVEKFIKEQHEPYLRTLADMFPDTYGKLLAPLFGHSSVTTLPELKEEELGEMPGPNVTLPDGGKTYDTAGLQALMDWRDKKSQQEMLKRFKPHLDTIQKEGEKAKKIAQVQETTAKSKARTDAALADLKTWEGGEEYFDAIVAEANTLDPRYDVETALNIAWRKVAYPKLLEKNKADETTIRAKVIKELKDKAAAKAKAKIATDASGGPKVTPGSSGSVDDQIRNAWKKAGLRAV